MSLNKVVECYELGREKELKILNKFELGVFIREDEGNIIGDYLLKEKGNRDVINLTPSSNGSILPLLVDNSTGSSYRDLALYFNIDYFVGLGLFGYTIENWFNLLCSRKDLKPLSGPDRERKVKICLKHAKLIWTAYDLIPFECGRVCTMKSQLGNLQAYQSLPSNLQKELTYDLRKILTL